MMIHGIAPGPQVMTARPQLFWGMVVSMWLGNLMLVILNLPLIGLWVRLLKLPYRFLFPSILTFCCIGVYSLSNSALDVVLTAFFGLLGYLLASFDCEPAPLLLGFILGPMMEENFRRAMLMSRGDATIFFREPISLSLLIMTVLLLALIIAPTVRQKRDEAFHED
jgi:putative tricarboxylic transport membrane protein